MHNPFDEINQRLTKIESMLVQLSNHTTENTNNDTWFTLPELSEYLPGKPSKLTIYSWTHRKVIPNHKPGKRLSFLKSEIDAWLRGNSKMTTNDINKVAQEFIIKNKTK